MVAVVLMRSARRWFPVRVEGESMLPTLQPGDLLAVRPLRAAEPHSGQIVVVRSAEREVVKRVVDPKAPLGLDEYWIEGDNAAASTDSRTAGSVKRDEIAGVVRARYKPSARFFR